MYVVELSVSGGGRSCWSFGGWSFGGRGGYGVSSGRDDVDICVWENSFGLSDLGGDVL